MNKRVRYLIFGLLIILGGSLVITACKSSQTVSVEPTATTRIAVSTPTSESIATVPVVEEQEDQCLICHTDKQMLIDTAKPEQEVVSENEGAG